MQIACPACQTRYSVPDGAIPAEGRTVRCAKCRHSWFESGDGGGDAGVAPADRAAPVAPAAPITGGWEEAAADPAAGFAGQQPDPGYAQPDTDPQPMPAETEAYAVATPTTSAQPSPYAQSFDGGAGYLGPAHADRADAGVTDGETTPPTPQGWHDAATFDPTAAVPVAAPEAIAAATPAPIRVEPMADVERPAGEGVAVEDWEDEPAAGKSRLKLLIAVIVVLLAVAAAAFAAVRYFGAPGWLPVGQVAFAPASENLELDFPADKQDRRTLPNGLQFFAASGTVTNIGQATERVPDVQVVLRDAQERIVYTWELEPPKREIGPGETVSINEAVTDVPASARLVEIGWKAG